MLAQSLAGGGCIPGPNGVGHLLMSLDGSNWESVKPVVGADDGWLSNADGDLLVEGWLPNG